MSVINQMLNQLEQRGAHDALEQVQVRAVPQVRRNSSLYWLLSALALAIGLAAWQWLPLRQQSVAVSHIAPSAVIAPSVVVASAVPAVATQIEPLAETAAPALHLSFELSSIPLPVVSRPGVGQPVDIGHPEDHGVAPASDNVKPQSRQPVRELAVIPSKAKTQSAGVPMKQVSSAQLADAEFAKAAVFMQQGRIAEAMAGYEATLHHNANHDAARQAWVALLLESKRGADAERVLQDGLSRRPEHTGFAMLLARLQVQHGALEQATATLAKSLPYADTQADFQAFFAALLQRQNRHKEAINHYQIALQLTPGNGVWLMGFGISLQAVQRSVDAKDAYQRALQSNSLSPNLQAFVQQKLRGL